MLSQHQPTFPSGTAGGASFAAHPGDPAVLWPSHQVVAHSTDSGRQQVDPGGLRPLGFTQYFPRPGSPGHQTPMRTAPQLSTPRCPVEAPGSRTSAQAAAPSWSAAGQQGSNTVSAVTVSAVTTIAVQYHRPSEAVLRHLPLAGMAAAAPSPPPPLPPADQRFSMGDLTPSPPTVVPLASSGDSQQQQQQQLPYTTGGEVSIDGDPAADALLQCIGSSSSLETAAPEYAAGYSKWLVPLSADERVFAASVPPQPPPSSTQLQSAMRVALGQGIFRTLRALMLRQQSTYVQQLFDLHELSQVQGLLMCEMQVLEMPFEGDGLSTDRISPRHAPDIAPGAQPAD